MCMISKLKFSRAPQTGRHFVNNNIDTIYIQQRAVTAPPAGNKRTTTCTNVVQHLFNYSFNYIAHILSKIQTA